MALGNRMLVNVAGTASKRRKKQVEVGVLCLLFALIQGCEKPKPEAPPPPVVEVMSVVAEDVPISQTWVGSLVADVNAEIRAQVSGYLQSQVYQNGAFVDAGSVMFQIDPRPFQAALDQAKGTLAQAQAKLTADELNAKRSAELYKKQVISQQQYDDQMQTYEGSKAAFQSAQASVEQAQLNLAFTKIVAPVDGIASIATVQVGDLVGPSSGVLATVVKVDPMKVKFAVPEQGYVKFIEKFFNDPSKSPFEVPDKKPNMELSLQLANGVDYPGKGKLTTIDNTVSLDTGSLLFEGLFPNPGRLLRPGQFGLVTAVTHKDDGAIVVPQRAVIDLQGIKMLAVVGSDNKVDIREVELGPTLGSDQIVLKGISAGDRVVVEGVQKVKQGEVVDPKPYTPDTPERTSDPEMDPSPTPETTA